MVAGPGLKGEHPALGKHGCRSRHDPRQVGEAPVAGGERRRGLVVAHLGRGRLGLRRGKVRRVRDDQVERGPGRQPLEPVRLMEFHASREAVRGRVLRGESERLAARVQRGDAGARESAGKRERDRPPACAQVEDGPRGLGAAGDDRLDEELGLRPRDQGPAVRREAEAVEFGEPEDVLQRLPAAPAARELADRADLGLGERSLELEVKAHPGQAEGVAHEELRVQPRRLDPLPREEFGGLLHDLEHGQHGCGGPALAAVRLSRARRTASRARRTFPQARRGAPRSGPSGGPRSAARSRPPSPGEGRAA